MKHSYPSFTGVAPFRPALTGFLVAACERLRPRWQSENGEARACCEQAIGPALFLITALVLAMPAGGQDSPPPNAPPGAPIQEGAVTPIEQPAAAAPRNGQKLVAQAAQRVAAEPAIAAELRYRIDAFGHQLLGTGSYVQLGRGQQRLLRLDLKMQVGGKPATLQEIRGTDYYWIRRNIPPAEPSLGRADLRLLRSEFEQPSDAPQDVMPQANWIMLGGLPTLLAALERNFAFDEPRADEIRYTGAGGQVQSLPIWVVGGRWKPSRLKALGGGAAAKKGTGEQLPDSVELVLGRTEDVLPLFPYRITYRQDGQSDEAKAAEPRELLSLELFNVSRQPNIDRRQFEFSPSEQFLDLTPTLAERFGTGRLR